MYISMIPDKSNKVINASQGDVNRKFEFMPYDNEGLVDISNIQPNPLPSYNTSNGGTETLLPINTSTPSTTPLNAIINGDEVYFNERVSDGNEQNIEKIKGNTLVFNQLIPVDAQTSGSSNGIAFTNNADGSWTISGTATATAQRKVSQDLSVTNGHKYFIKGCMPTGGNNYQLRIFKNSGKTLIGTDTGNGYIITADNTYTNISLYFIVFNGNTINDKIYPQIFDLTQMFGIDNEPSTLQEFNNLFLLPYYNYNTGSLLSFNGSGIKTTGKNLLEKAFIYNDNSFTYTDGFPILKGNYVFSFDEIIGATSWRFNIKMWNLNGTEITDNALSPDETLYYNSSYKGYLSRLNITSKSVTLNITQDCYIRICFAVGDTSSSMVSTNAQLEFGSVQSEYESYIETTIDLPISTYFQTGMKSAGTVYDELTETKAITRIGMVDLGSLTWYAQSTYGFYTTGLSSIIKSPVDNYTKANIICPIRETSTWAELATGGTGTNYIAVSSGYLGIADNSGMTATQFKDSLNGVYLFYELETPTEASIETAALVTNYCSVDLELEDDTLVCYTTEELTAKAGRHECKISLSSSDKISSAKFYLNVESRP